MDRIAYFSVLVLMFVRGDVLGTNVPDPVAFFPLNATYGTSEIKGRSPAGVPHDVNLAPGRYGEDDGSFEFHGTPNSYIEIPNRAGGTLDVRHSITILCWIYYEKHEGDYGGIFVYVNEPYSSVGVEFKMYGGRVNPRFNDRSYTNLNFYLWGPLGQLKDGWHFVGTSYNGNTGDAILWIDGVMDEKKNKPEVDLGTQPNVRIGSSGFEHNGNFKGKITQMCVFDVALTQDQVQEIKAQYVKPMWKDLGCWKENKANRALPVLLGNFKSQKQQSKLKKVELCFQAAKKAGKKYFTLKRHGNCWASDDELAYMKYGASKNCWHGLGDGLNNYVYKGQW